MNRDHATDLKDLEIYPEPATFHIIKCTMCGEKKRTFVRYTRVCHWCRRTNLFRQMNANVYKWDAWEFDPNLGYSVEDLPDGKARKV